MAERAALQSSGSAGITAGPRPVLRVPFRCGERWVGTSRSGHSPSYWSLDLNYGSGDDDLGRPVKTSAAGTVSRSAYDAGGYGNYVEVNHGNGWRTLYAHLQVREVSVGQQVGPAARLGRVGQTGNVTGPHLHYEQIRDGIVVEARFGESTWAAYPGPKTYERGFDC